MPWQHLTLIKQDASYFLYYKNKNSLFYVIPIVINVCLSFKMDKKILKKVELFLELFLLEMNFT